MWTIGTKLITVYEAISLCNWRQFAMCGPMYDRNHSSNLWSKSFFVCAFILGCSCLTIRHTWSENLFKIFGKNSPHTSWKKVQIFSFGVVHFRGTTSKTLWLVCGWIRPSSVGEILNLKLISSLSIAALSCQRKVFHSQNNQLWQLCYEMCFSVDICGLLVEVLFRRFENDGLQHKLWCNCNHKISRHWYDDIQHVCIAIHQWEMKLLLWLLNWLNWEVNLSRAYWTP